MRVNPWVYYGLMWLNLVVAVGSNKAENLWWAALSALLWVVGLYLQEE